MGPVSGKATNLSVRPDLLADARSLGIHLSAEFGKALVEVVRRKRAERWLQDNDDAIAAYNRHVDRDGLWSDGLRTF